MAARLLGSSQMMNAASSYSSSSSRMFVHHDNTDRKNVTFKSTNFSIRAHSSSSAGESVVTLLYYGAGNVRSVRNAIRLLGYDIKDVNAPEDILSANRLIFPGVGAFALAMDVLNHNGQGKGFDLDLIQLVSDAVSIPVIASSGAGAVEHFSDVFKKTNASAALAAGIFHRKEIPIRSVKEHLLKEGVEVRMLTADYLPQDVQAEKVAAIR